MAAWIRAGDGGRLEASPEALERLGEGACALLDAPAPLLLGVCRGAPEARAPRVLLAGDLSRLGFTEVVSLIVHARVSGVLRLLGPAATRRVIFEEGEVRGACSERAGERLPDVIARMGLVAAGEMEAVRAEIGADRRAGRIAVERGLLTERALWSAVQEHVTTIFQAILLEGRGAFVLCDETADDVPTVPGLSAEGLLMEGVRRLDELRVWRGRGGAPERTLGAFIEAFRDIFATAQDAGAGDALFRAAADIVEEDAAHAALLHGLAFSTRGELPEDEILERASRIAKREGRDANELLSDVLSTVLLFLLFVTGEHLEESLHQALHARVKALVARG